MGSGGPGVVFAGVAFPLVEQTGLGALGAVGLAAGLDDGAVEHHAADHGAAEPPVIEGFRPFGEGSVGRDRDGALFLPVGGQLKQQFRAGLVQLDVAELVQAK